MPINLYTDWFNQVNEQRLYDDLINETIQFYGIDCFYMPRTSESSFDLMFGEDPTSKFTEAYPVEIYVQSVDDFEGGALFSKFGLEVKKQARFLITNRSFGKNVPSTYKRPREGDLIWMSNFKALFEIKYADEEYFFYTFGNSNIYGYSMIVEKFRYSNERISTETEVDDEMDAIVPTYDFQMANDSTTHGTYQFGELVSQGNTANATVVSWDLPSLLLRLKHINGTFANTLQIVGANSNASYILANNTIVDDTNRVVDDNRRLQVQANGILNWSENNPFGEPT